jgi:hypothetical protein
LAADRIASSACHVRGEVLKRLGWNVVRHQPEVNHVDMVRVSHSPYAMMTVVA